MLRAVMEKDQDIKIGINTDNVIVEGVTKEEDPSVPSWAKRPNKPDYTAEEVGALPENTFIPNKLSDLEEDTNHRTVTDDEKDKWNEGTKDYNDLINKPTKLSEFQNDEGFITGYNETDPTVPGWAKRPNKPEYTAEEVGALPDTTKIPVNASELNNDAGYITEEDMEAVTTADIDKMWEGTY